MTGGGAAGRRTAQGSTALTVSSGRYYVHRATRHCTSIRTHTHTYTLNSIAMPTARPRPSTRRTPAARECCTALANAVPPHQITFITRLDGGPGTPFKPQLCAPTVDQRLCSPIALWVGSRAEALRPATRVCGASDVHWTSSRGGVRERPGRCTRRVPTAITAQTITQRQRRF
ncbi:hypothetical protein BD413DRAFT_37276 [Trametes elegans]|nr:hypothetical protein BD413DRAFT_37276 [Trametes elegans]